MLLSSRAAPLGVASPFGAAMEYTVDMRDRTQQAQAGFEMVLALYEFGEATLRQKLRRTHPDASEERIDT